MKDQLGKLYNPKYFVNPININGQTKKRLLKYLTLMLEIRIIEEEIADLIRMGKVKAPCHLCIGQEAISVGMLANASKNDLVFGNHRSHGHYIAVGGNIKKLFLEILGHPEGCSKGMGGSMHLVDIKSGFIGSAPIVSGTIPLALGAALNSSLKNKKKITYVFFGDGACEEGVVHECFNLAKLYKLPIVFIIENNLFSSHLDLNFRQPSNKMSRFGDANLIKNFTVDGNDVVKISNIINTQSKFLKSGQGPILIECITYRWLGHVGPNQDIDVGLLRNKKSLNNWKKRDPINRLYLSMLNKKLITNNQFNLLEKKIKDKIKKISKFSLKKKFYGTPYHEKFVY